MIWVPYNPNPCEKSVGDCTVRAMSLVLDADWYDAYDFLCDRGRRDCDMPSSDAVWGDALLAEGYQYVMLPHQGGCRYTAEDFCRDHPRGTYVLAFGKHVATVRDGRLFDSWDSRREVPIYYFRRA